MAKKTKKLEEIIRFLPKHGQSITGAPMEPICVIMLGRKSDIKRSFARAGWYQAEALGAISLFRALAAGLFDLSYRTGPFSTGYVHRSAHLGFEMPTKSDTFRRRHHIRLWRTGYRIGRKPVWVGSISYDRSIGVEKANPLVPTHHISPDLNIDEALLARTFKVEYPKYVRLAGPETGTISNGDKYEWNGKALLLDLA